MKYRSGICWITGSAFFYFLAMASLASAQSIQIDGTTPTTPGSCTGSCTIEGGLQRGSNLFHSFSRFNIDEGATVLFRDPGVTNILSRVTLRDPDNTSKILGTLGVLGGSANLFLVNPNGIIFGPNASLDVSGSFVATTANAIQFGDQGSFEASTSEIPLLTVNPSALWFTQNANGSIVNRSRVPVAADPSGLSAFGLTVPNERSLLLIGGNVLLEGGGVNAFGGQVELGGLAASGVIGLDFNGNNLKLTFPEGVARADVALTNRASVNAIGNGGGSITISARNIGMSERSRLWAGIAPGLGAVGRAGDVTLNATGDVTATDESRVFNIVLPSSQANSGNINIRAGSLYLNNRSALQTLILGQGMAGDVNVDVREGIVTIAGESLINSVLTEETEGGSGNIRIITGNLFLTDGSQLGTSTLGKGNAGSIIVQTSHSISLASDSRVVSNVEPGAVGNGGDIRITTRKLSLTGGTQLTASVLPGGQGSGGSILVNASESVSLSGFSKTQGFSSGLFTSTQEAAIGQAGNITVNTDVFRITDGATVNAQTLNQNDGGNITINATTFEAASGGQIITTTSNSGNAGNITLNVTDRVTISGSDPTYPDRLNNPNFEPGAVQNEGAASGLFASTRPSSTGLGGAISIANPGQLTVQNGARISASSEGQGSPGLIDINAGTIRLETSGSISSTLGSEATSGGAVIVNARTFTASNGGNVSTTTSSTRNGNAGNIIFRILDDLTLTGAGSGIFANTNPGSNGAGGDIDIDPQAVTIADGAHISVDGRGQGNAGNIRLQARSLTLNQGTISATTTSGEGGNLFLEVRDLLLLRNNSQISTNAGGTGNGGNITIAAQFIVANPFENSDITANAFAGRGGNINITTKGIFGIEPRVRLTPLSDITASSELGVSGTIAINSPEVDPSRDTAELPETFEAPPILQGCQVRGPHTASSFVDVGRGGLPPNPAETLSDQAVWQDLRPLTPAASDRSPATHRQSQWHSQPVAANVTEPIVEAQGWVVNANGQVVLTAEAPTATPHGSGFSPATCQPG
jgi:filamentous hemagglutinin family protein